MKIISIHEDFSKEEVLSSVFVYPTDTCYGIGCNALDAKLVERIYQIKGRDEKKPLSIMADSLEMFQKYGKTNTTVKKLIRKYLPGALTIIVEKTKNIPDFLNPETKTIGIRIPDHHFCLHLIKRLGVPIITTSANITGEKNLYSLSDIIQTFQHLQKQPDILFDGGELSKNVPPSTVVSVVNNEVKVCRQGDIFIG